MSCSNYCGAGGATQPAESEVLEGWGNRAGFGFLSFLWAYLLPIGKKGESVDGRGCSDRSIHIGGWDLMVGSKKHFLLSFLYSGGFT